MYTLAWITIEKVQGCFKPTPFIAIASPGMTMAGLGPP